MAGVIQKNEVINLRSYRGSKDDDTWPDDPGPQYLHAGTTLLLGQYIITGYLNCGGFGITYFANDSLGRAVVIKECFPSELCFRSGNRMVARSRKYKKELDSIVTYFVKEAHRLATARHDNIVHVHQIFEENDTAYMAMDFIDGQDLLAIVEEGKKRLAPKDIESLVHKMLDAIKYVHDRGMLHRDISPDNILIDKSGEPILIDFGAARENGKATGHQDYSKLKFVKDGYSPQEFYIAGSEQGTWSDLYSLAASMFHVISGELPIDGQRRLAALAAKKPDPYEPLAGRITGYPMRFLRALDKALEILPDQRIQSADEWLERISSKRPTTLLTQPLNVSSMIEALPAFDELTLSSYYAKLAPKKGRVIAASVAVITALSGVGYFGLQGTTNGEDVRIASAKISAPVAAEIEESTVMLLDSSRTAANGGAPDRAAPDLGLALAEPPSSAITMQPREIKPDPRPVAAPVDEATPQVGQIAPQLTIPASAEQSSAISKEAPVNWIAKVEPLRPLAVVPIEAPSIPQPQITLATVAPLETGNLTLLPFDTATERPSPMMHLSALVTESGVAPLPIERLPKPISLTADVTIIGEGPATTTDATFAPAEATRVARLGDIAELPDVKTEKNVTAAARQPPEFAPNRNLAPNQVVFSHWDVHMPFEAELERVRNANTARITSISENTDYSVSGDWIAEGVIIYSFNGERLAEDTSISVHFLESLHIDPDGYARATVRYRNPVEGILDRGLLAVPVVRELGLADGSLLEAHVIDRNWTLSVKKIGRNNGLRVGDIVVGERSTGTVFASHEDLARSLNTLAAREIDVAELTVVRDGALISANWRLASARN